jgi:hypothetical protein
LKPPLPAIRSHHPEVGIGKFGEQFLFQDPSQFREHTDAEIAFVFLMQYLRFRQNARTCHHADILPLSAQAESRKKMTVMPTQRMNKKPLQSALGSMLIK